MHPRHLTGEPYIFLPIDQPVGKNDRCKAEEHTDKDALSTYSRTFRQQAMTCGEHHTAGDHIGISEPRLTDPLNEHKGQRPTPVITAVMMAARRTVQILVSKDPPMSVH